MTVFDATDKEYDLSKKMFLDGSVNIQRYDKVKYPQFAQLTDKQLSYFWLPQAIDLTRDKEDFKQLSPHEQHIFTSNLKRQIVLDSVQGRAPIAMAPIVSLPELEAWLLAWTHSEMIHSKSYTHIIRNLYANPSVIFDGILQLQEIVDCAKDISKYYDTLNGLILLRQIRHDPSIIEVFGVPNWTVDKYWSEEREYNLKKALWLCLNSINALEGVRFYVSFACAWAFAETKKMVGNATIIKLICRDENLHLASTQKLLQLLPEDDKDFVQIKKETHEETTKLFIEVVNQEKIWADYLFKDGSMIGLNADILKSYVEWIAHKRMKAIGLESPYKVGSNPLPWTQKWIAGNDVQVAPQETEISRYTTGEVNMDVSEDRFRNFKL